MSRSICREMEPDAEDTILKPHSRVEVCAGHPIWEQASARNGTAPLARHLWRIWEWQHENDGWPSSMAMANRRRISRFRCFARITAAPISCRSPAASSMAHGATTNPAAPSRRRWSGGACLLPAFALDPEPVAVPLCNGKRATLSFGTRWERIAPESAVRACTLLFTARYRLECDAAHHMQHGHDRPQPAAKHKG